ncbi:MAG: carboxylating nicotinate-nucleotide diphosphorylase [Promethearchaeota archaeon]
MLPRPLLEERLLQFLREDLGYGDVSSAFLPAGRAVKARVVAKSAGLLAGVEAAAVLFELLGVGVRAKVREGGPVEPGTTVLELEGPARQVLAGERTALNLMMKMSAVATTTAHLVAAIREELEAAKERGLSLPPVRLACTRKTTPGFRVFEKHAVLLGGGDAHRWNLDDAVLLKDTHLALAGGRVDELLREAKRVASFTKKLEVEVERVEDAVAAARNGADVVMLDNMTPGQVERAVAALREAGLRDSVVLEASGGIRDEAAVRRYATTGVDVVSCGFVTMAPDRWVDLSLRVVGE